MDYTALQIFLAITSAASLSLIVIVARLRAAAAKLDASNRCFRAYIDNSQDAIWCLELDEPMPVTLKREEQIDWIMKQARFSEANRITENLQGANGGADDTLVGRLLSEQQKFQKALNRNSIAHFVDSGYRVTGLRSPVTGSVGGGVPVFESCVIGHVEDGLLLRVWGTDADITARLAAQVSVEESEERFVKAFHSTPISVTLTDLDSLTYIDVNRGFERLHGYARDEVIGKSSLDLGIWEDSEQREKLGQEVRREGIVRDVEIKFRTKSGQLRHGLFSAETCKLGERNVVVSNIQDITELRRVEQSLRQSEERFYKTFKKNPDAVAISTFGTARYVDVNEAFERHSGYRRDEIIGKTPEELRRWTDPQQRARLAELFKKFGSVRDFEMTFRTKNGEIQTGLVSCERVTIENESLVISTVRDLTEQRRAESALVKSRELITKAFRNSPDAIIISEMSDGTILEVNDAFLKMTGLSRPEVMGRSAADVGFWKDLRQRATVMEAMRKEGRLSQVEVEFMNTDGQDVIVSYSGELIEMEGKICIVSVGRDITERKRIEEMLHAYQERLKSLASKLTLAEEEVRRQTATELHDGLCQEMAAMIMRLGVHRGSLEKREQIESVDAVLEVLKGAMRSARAIVNDLSQQQMFERGIVPAIRSLAERSASRDGFELAFFVDDAGKPLADSVKIVLFRSVQELLSNVSKHARASTLR